MASKLFSSQNKSSSDERDSLTPCNMHLTPCNMRKNIARLLQCKVNGDLFRYIITADVSFVTFCNQKSLEIDRFCLH